MTRPEEPRPSGLAAAGLSRRELLAYTAAFGSTFLAAQGLAAESPCGRPRNSQTQALEALRHEEVDQPLGACPIPRR